MSIAFVTRKLFMLFVFLRWFITFYGYNLNLPVTTERYNSTYMFSVNIDLDIDLHIHYKYL